MYETWLPTDVEARLVEGEQLLIVDVRELDEWDRGHIDGAKHIPLSEIPDRVSELDAKQMSILVCHSGGRSARACEYLAAKGYQVINMLGGMSQWNGSIVR